MNTILIADNLKSLVSIPDFESNYIRQVWLVGRNRGINVLQRHVRQYPYQVLPTLVTAPNNIKKELGADLAAVWLEGYNAPMQYFQTVIDEFIKTATFDARQIEVNP